MCSARCLILALAFLFIAQLTLAQTDSIALQTNLQAMEDQMWAEYPKEFTRITKLHQQALASACLGCQALSYKLMGKFMWANGEYPAGLAYFRKAVSLSKKVGDRATLGSAYDLMGNTFYYQAYYDSGIHFFNKALKVYEEDKNIQGMITVLHNISLMYHRQGNFKKTIEYLFREEQLKDSLPESVHDIEAMGAMGSLMIDSIYYHEEITDELSDLRTYRLKGDKKSMARAYRNIAKAYRQLEEYVLAARYFVKASALMNDMGIVPDWDLAATDYRDANIKDSCFYYHYLAKQNFSKMTQPNISYTLELLGDAHLHFNKPDSAKIYYDSALRMNYRMNNRITFTGIHRHLVNVNRQLKNYPAAEQHLAIGLDLSKEVALIHEMNLYSEGKALYEQMGDYKKALWFSEKYRLYRDSITKAETALDLTKLQAEFKTAKKTREVSELQQKNLLSAARLKTRNLQIALAGSLLLVIATLGGLYYTRYRQNKKLNERLQISNKEKEGLLHEIHHRVKNNLQIISSLISLKARQSTSPETNEALQQLAGRIFSMGLVHEKLYQNENIQTIRLDEYLAEISRYLISSFEEKEHPVSLQLNCMPVEIELDKALTCGLITNELITNSMKYAFIPEQEYRQITFGLTQTGHAVALQISDNGNSSKPVTGNFKKSFGSRFVDQLVITKLGGEWNVHSENGFHVTIKFTIGSNGAGKDKSNHR